jgi:hypothetical protein
MLAVHFIREIRMALIRFGDFAIDWDFIYAVVLNSKTRRVEIHLDAARPKGKSPAFKLILPIYEGHTADRAWKLACNDKRFQVFAGCLAVDMSKVLGVMKFSPKSMILFRISDGNCPTLLIHSDIAEAILRHDHGSENGSRVDPVAE